MLDVLLDVIETVGALQGVAHCRISAVGAEQQGRIDGALLAGFQVFKGNEGFLQVEVETAVIEMKKQIRKAGGNVQQFQIEAPARHGVNGLAFFPVGLVAQFAVYGVHHASRHGQSHFFDFIADAGFVNGVPAAHTQG